MQKLVSLLIKTIDCLTGWLGVLLGWLCLAMVILTTTVVAMRYLFQAGNIIFLQESVIYLHSTIFLLAVGWAFQRNGHVRVDVFYRGFDPVRKAWVNSLGILIFLFPFCVFLFFASFDFVSLSWQIQETSSDAGGIPLVYLLKSLIPAMSIVLGLQGFAELLRNALFLCGLTDSSAMEPDIQGSNEQ